MTRRQRRIWSLGNYALGRYAQEWTTPEFEGIVARSNLVHLQESAVGTKNRWQF